MFYLSAITCAVTVASPPENLRTKWKIYGLEVCFGLIGIFY